MKAQIISTAHTVEIDGNQIDLYFNFQESTLTGFIEGKQILHSNYTPSYKSFNYINIVEVCTTLFKNHKEREAIKEAQAAKEEGRI